VLHNGGTMNNPEAAAWAAITTLLDKADGCGARGDSHAAAAHYGAALDQASRLNQWPAGMAERLAFARDTCTQYSAGYARHLQQHLQAAGFDPQRSSPRFIESLEILLGRTRPYLQQPQLFYFPGLPAVAFHDAAQFPWVAQLEQASEAIRAEFTALISDPGLFTPMAPVPEGAAPAGAGLGTCYVWKEGKAIVPVAGRCPETLRALAGAPLDHITDRSPSVAFSVLAPGARIPPGTGLLNTRLTCQLPLVAPGKCVLRVGNSVHEWRAGKALLFDDTIEHEFLNDSAESCAVLMFDVWRPELSADERELVTGLVKAIGSFSGITADLNA
jgi:hypothetical protein